MSRRFCFLTVLAGVLLVPSLALTQQSRRGGAAQPRRGGGFDLEQGQKRMLLHIKQQLGAAADEWKTLLPKIEKVMTAQRALPAQGERPGGPPAMGGERRGGPGEFGGPGGPGRPEGQDGAAQGDRPGRPPRDEGAGEPLPNESEAVKAHKALRAAVDDENATADDVAAKLAVFRQTRDKAREELEAARKELQAAVTPRQEAVLVLMGLLE